MAGRTQDMRRFGVLAAVLGRAVLGAVLGVLLSTALLAPARAATAECMAYTPPPRGTVNTAQTANPLDDHLWAAGHGKAEELWAAWCDATGTQKTDLGKIALRPRMLWFGHWIAASDIAGRVRDYIAASQRGNPDVMAQLAVFRLWPHEEKARGTRLTTTEQAAYRHWIDNLAVGIGSSHVALVLEPDLGIVYTPQSAGSLYVGPTNRAERLRLVRYAAQTLSALPNTHVYIDGSSSDWLTPDTSAAMLRAAGVGYARGFALGATHYSLLANEVMYAHSVANRLSALGIPGRKAIIDTSDNARGFTFHQYYDKHPNGWFDNAEICTSTTERRCVTLGIPPTWKVAATSWGMSSTIRAEAAAHVDGFTWFGRSWQYAQASGFRLTRALGMVRTSPWN